MVESVMGSGPMLLTGKAGCDLDRLAHAIHAMSARRNLKPVEVATVPPVGEGQVALAEQAFLTSLVLLLGRRMHRSIRTSYRSCSMHAAASGSSPWRRVRTSRGVR